MDIGKMMPEELSAAEVSSLFDWSEDELAAMDEVEFRARFRERCHHTMEIQVYEHAFRGKPLAEKQIATAEKYLRSWYRRGLSHDCHEYRYVQKLLEFARTLIAGEVPDLSSYGPEWLTPREVRVFERALYECRSVRHWDISRRIPDELIDKILRAGLLAAHAYGLGGVWLTFNRKMRERLIERFAIPEYIDLVTYVDVGYPSQSPYPPLRPEPEDVIFARI